MDTDSNEFKGKLKLSNDIFALNAIKLYGFTYGNYGLVSIKAFVMVN